MEHECTIGLLHHCDYDELITLSDLINHIEEEKEYNDFLRKSELFKNDFKNLRSKLYTLISYGDKRESTDLTRFDFCPYCSKKIDWSSIGKGD